VWGVIFINFYIIIIIVFLLRIMYRNMHM
jgi:hypothetical protein